MTAPQREKLATELAYIRRGPRASDPATRRPGLLPTVMIAFAIPGAIAISAALAARLFIADPTPVLLWIWGSASALGLLMLLLFPRTLGAWLERREIRRYLPHYAPGGSRARQIESALAAGVMHRATFPVTQTALGPGADDQPPMLLLKLEDDRWLVLNGPEFEDLHALEANTCVLAPMLDLTWIDATGDLVAFEHIGAPAPTPCPVELTAEHPALAPFHAQEHQFRAVTLVSIPRAQLNISPS